MLYSGVETKRVDNLIENKQYKIFNDIQSSDIRYILISRSEGSTKFPDISRSSAYIIDEKKTISDIVENSIVSPWAWFAKSRNRSRAGFRPPDENIIPFGRIQRPHKIRYHDGRAYYGHDKDAKFSGFHGKIQKGTVFFHYSSHITTSFPCGCKLLMSPENARPLSVHENIGLFHLLSL